MRIAVIDGQGGGIGKAVVERLRQAFGDEIQIVALGTNVLATSLMLKAGAHEGASGENAIVYNAARADLIVGTIGILAANAMLGELSPAMARAVAESPARKVLIPLNKCNIQVVGTKNEPLPQYIDEAIAYIRNYMKGDKEE